MDKSPKTTEMPAPERCPACGALPTDDTDGHRIFACGTAWSKLVHKFYSGCKNALTVMPELLSALFNVRAALNCHYDWGAIEYEYGAQIDAAIAKAGGTLPGPISIEEELARR